MKLLVYSAVVTLRDSGAVYKCTDYYYYYYYRKKSHTDQHLNFGSHHPLNHKLAVIRTLLERCYSIVTEENDRKKEEHVAKALSKCGYPPWTIDRIKQDIMEKSLKDETKKVKTTRGNYKGMVVVPYVKGLSEAFARILKSHGIDFFTRQSSISQ